MKKSKNIISRIVFLLVFVLISTIFNLNYSYSATYDCNSCITCNNHITNSIVSGDILRITSGISATSTCINTDSKSNFTIDCQNNLISGNNDITSYGIYLRSNTQNVTVKNCRIENFDKGVYMIHSNNLTFDNLDLRNNYEGFSQLYSGNVILKDSVIEENERYDYYFNPYVIEHCNNSLINVLSNSREIYYSNSQVNLNNQEYASVTLCNADSSSLNDISIIPSQNFKNNGFNMFFTQDSHILNLNVSNSYSIIVQSSSNNIFENIYSKNNTYYGIYLDVQSNNNLIKGSYFSENSQFGLYIRGNNNTLDTITSEFHNQVGLVIDGNNNIVANSSIIANMPQGVYVFKSDNIFYNNIFANNQNYIQSSSTSNQLSTNLDCTKQNIVGNSCFGGNYWSKLVPMGSSCSDYQSNYLGICHNDFFYRAEKFHSELCLDSDLNGICDSVYNLSNSISNSVAVDFSPLKGNIFSQSVDLYELEIYDNSNFNAKVGDSITFSAIFEKNNLFFGSGTCRIYIYDSWNIMTNTGSSYEITLTVNQNEMLEYFISCYESDQTNHIQESNSFFVRDQIEDDTTDNLVYLYSIDDFEYPYAMEIKDDYLYVGSRFKGLEIYDISDNLNILKTDEFILNSNTYPVDIKIFDNTAFVLLRNSSIICFDISDKYNIQKTCDYYDSEIRGGFSLEVDSNYLYVPSYESDSIHVLDISNLNNIVEVDSYTDSIVLNGAYKLEKIGYYIYLTSFFSNTITIFDISIPNNIVLINTINEVDFQVFKDIEISNMSLYILNDEKLFIYNISNPVNPVKIGEFGSINFENSKSLEISDKGYIFVSSSGTNKITVVDIRNLDLIVEAEIFSNQLIAGIEKINAYDDYVYTINSLSNSLSIFNASFYVGENQEQEIVFIPQIIVDYSVFDNSKTTNFSIYSKEELENLEKVIFTNSFGSINFTQNITILTSLTLTNNIRIENNRIEVNSNILPQFNKAAIIKINNINFVDPVIYRDNQLCPSNICQLISYQNNIVTFSVTEFSYYTIRENSPDDSSDSGDSSSGSSGGSGGGSPSSSPSNPITNIISGSSGGVANVCNTNYLCGEWSDCINNGQNRTCTDFNKCSEIVKSESRICYSNNNFEERVKNIENIQTRDYMYYYAKIEDLDKLYTFSKRVPDKFIIVDEEEKKQYVAILNIIESEKQKVYSIKEIISEQDFNYIKEIGLSSYDFNQTFNDSKFKVLEDNKEIDNMSFAEIGIISALVLFLTGLFVVIGFNILA